ncbi:MAG TPA: hypothetical protein ENK18_18200 [Deltaproteobacteria bacterium]|nr:hypothetical protein [Deltaproteobacteria bacterium]
MDRQRSTRIAALVAGTSTVALLAGIAWLVLGGRHPGPRVRRDYNVLLIVVDTLRADHLGAWGYERDTSPNLDALAASGIRLDQATSQAPWTTPSIGSLMTSQYPATLGITRERSALPESATTLAELLQAEGWATAAAVSHSFCGAEWRFDQGFDTFDESNVLGPTGISSPGITELALGWLDIQRREPFFLWLHYFDPHFSYLLHRDHDPDPGSDYDGGVVSGAPIGDLNQLRPTMDRADLDQLARLYDSEIAFTDAQIGRVLDRLEALGLADDTVVIFTADHGEEFLDHRLLGHGKTLYQELVHVPAIVRCPHWEPGVITAPVGNVDLLPTLLECLGLPEPEGLVGTSLGPGGGPPSHPVLSQVDKRRHLTSLRDGDLKLIANRQRDPPRLELYDLSVDPTERNDLAAEGGQRLSVLTEQLLRLERLSRERALPPAVLHLEDDQRRLLRTLGYIDD